MNRQREGLHYFPDKAGRNRPYELKECLGCKQVTFIPYPGGDFCSKKCVVRDGSYTNKNKRPWARPGPKMDYILALDPGGARCGYALYEHEGKEPDSTLVQSGVVAFEALTDFLQRYPYATVVVCESYIIRPGLNHGSSGKTMQAIGQIQMWGKTLGIPVVMQQPSILPIAHKITGTPKPKGHLPDDKSAILHGAYWLAGKRWYLNVLERGKEAS